MKRNFYYTIPIGLLFLAAFLLTFLVLEQETPFLDKWSTSLVADLDNTFVFILFRWVTELGSGTFLIPFSVVAGLLLWLTSKDFLAAAMVPLGTLLGYKLNYWIKLVVGRERPRIFEEAEGVGFSYPSGHAMVALIAYGLVLYFFTKYIKSTRLTFWIKLSIVILIIFIGMSRYVIRVHYLTDVLAGYTFGIIFLICWIGTYHLFLLLKDKIFSV